MDNRRAYGLAKAKGIDTTGMSPKEVWEALKEKGVTVQNAEKSSDGAGGTHYPSQAEEENLIKRGITDNENNKNLPEYDEEEISNLLGKEYKGYKGQAAIDKLIQEKQGHIKAAFHREDIGDIDLLWGNEYLGLQHILTRREEQGIDTNEFLKDLAEVIEKGMFKKKNNRGNFEFWHNGKLAVIAPEYHGNKITYVLTAYKQSKKNYKTP